MVIIAKIRLTSAFLGELPKDPQGIRRFRKKHGQIIVDTKHWKEQFKAASQMIRLDTNLEALILPEQYEAPSLHLFRRKYSGANVEMFEAIRAGTILTFELATREDIEGFPTLDQVKVLLENIGKYLGLSQWGSKFKFGRFELESCYDKYADATT